MEVLERFRQAVQADVVAGGEPQLAGDGARQVGDRALHIIELTQYAAGPLVQCRARGGELGALADAVEEPCAELGFEAGDALADRRLGEKHALGSARK
jgi:hypothetical protein